MQKIIKRTLSVMLVLALSISSLAACGKKENTDNPSTTPAGDTTVNTGSENNSSDSTDTTPTAAEEPAMDLGGMEIIVGDWWSPQETPEPRNQKEEDTLAYRNEFMKKHNFTIKQVAVTDWGGMQELFTTSVMADDPAAHVFLLGWGWIAQPLANGLLYDLSTLKSFDFTEDKWIKYITDLMTFDGSIYGMAAGTPEPKLGVFWNKRLFQEAGLDPDLPYDLQASGEWTIEKYEELCKQLTRDTNNDGTIDTYAQASFSVDYLRGAITLHNAKFIGKDENGKFYNATAEPNFLEGAQWGISLIQKGYEMPAPEGANWDWFIAAFHDAKVAMTWAEQYKCGTWADMTDDWGFVLPPRKDANTPHTIYFNDNIAVIPSSYDAETVEKIAFAYNLFTNPTPGYEDDTDAWKESYYPSFRDERAVDETLALMFSDDVVICNDVQPFVYGTDTGPDFYWETYALVKTPAEKIEELTTKWETLIADANK